MNELHDLRFTIEDIAGIDVIEELEAKTAPGGGETVLPL